MRHKRPARLKSLPFYFAKLALILVIRTGFQVEFFTWISRPVMVNQDIFTGKRDTTNSQNSLIRLYKSKAVWKSILNKNPWPLLLPSPWTTTFPIRKPLRICLTVTDYSRQNHLKAERIATLPQFYRVHECG